jgi:hypoxanthine phosphoribosyltransferase
LAIEILASSGELATQLDPGDHEHPPALHLIGLGSGTRQLLADLAARLDLHDCRVTTDRVMLSRYGNGHDEEQVCIGQVIKTPVAGRDIVLVADIISSGLSLVYVVDWLHSKGARSVRICTLLDRTDARIIDIPLDFVGFRAPDEVLVGYGLSTCPQFRDLPYIASLLEAEDTDSTPEMPSSVQASNQAN